ncbi:MAG: hypothetical protein QOJ75_1187 [Chloroflexota bacterium]|jgi:hypothetical protein|nr:hypothetical protein [Chloroflexota bacterium]
MDQPPLSRQDADTDPDRVDVLFRPEARLRSPIVSHRPTAPGPAAQPAAHPDVPAFVLPPARELVRPMLWAFLAAAPVLALFGWLPAIVTGAVAVVVRVLDIRVGRATFSFGDGFLPFRGDLRWPRGVQEEDDVHWNWSPVRDAPRGQARG